MVMEGVTIKKEIKNSPGYFITSDGKVYNKNGLRIKTFYKPDGYERVALPSLRHSKKVNFSIHLLVAEAFLNGGSYTNDKLQVNHINGDKKNNNLSNLELVTGVENVNKAHDMGLYTYDLKVVMYDILTKDVKVFRSLRETSRYFNVTMNYIKPRIIISTKYPMLGRFVFEIDYKNYLNHISKLNKDKGINVYSHISKTKYVLSAYSQLSILFGLSYTTIGKILNNDKNKILYIGGYTITLNNIDNKIKFKSKLAAMKDRDKIWKKLIMDTKNIGPKWVGNQSLKSKSFDL